MIEIEVFKGKITETEVEGLGRMFRLKLSRHSEDGPQVDFVGDYIDRADAERVLYLWKTDPALLFLVTRLDLVMP